MALDTWFDKPPSGHTALPAMPVSAAQVRAVQDVEINEKLTIRPAGFPAFMRAAAWSRQIPAQAAFRKSEKP